MGQAKRGPTGGFAAVLVGPRFACPTLQSKTHRPGHQVFRRAANNVILSAVKDLVRTCYATEILRCAQDDRNARGEKVDRHQ